jgi:hypothetical protein
MFVSLPKQASFFLSRSASLQNKLQVISFSLAVAEPAPGLLLDFKMK